MGAVKEYTKLKFLGTPDKFPLLVFLGFTNGNYYHFNEVDDREVSRISFMGIIRAIHFISKAIFTK
jgi:hypothetical protein